MGRVSASLHGLVECLQRRGEWEELPALQEKLAQALKLTDVPVTSSCMCRTRAGSVTVSDCGR